LEGVKIWKRPGGIGMAATRSGATDMEWCSMCRTGVIGVENAVEAGTGPGSTDGNGRGRRRMTTILGDVRQADTGDDVDTFDRRLAVTGAKVA
jgi:hypothetical protein